MQMVHPTLPAGPARHRQNRLHVAVYELGRAVADYDLNGRLLDCTLSLEPWQVIDARAVASYPRALYPAVATRAGWLDFAGAALGGWAAVKLAIAAGDITPAPPVLGTTAGEECFRGGLHADSWWVEHAAICVEAGDPNITVEVFVDAARHRALDCLKERLPAVLELAPELAQRTRLTVEVLAEAFGPSARRALAA